MLKPQIFIGSSGESLPVVNKIKSELESEFECTSWNENFFELNKSTYDNLIKKSVCFDYAIFIGGKDDKVIRMSKGTEKTGIRDNVYLELGLYSGVLSPMRNYFVVHEDSTVASDWFGITVLTYNDDMASVEKCCRKLVDTIREEENNNRLTLLPANTLAFGYYENFVKHISQELEELEVVEIDGVSYNVSDYPKRLDIVLPENVTADWNGWARKFYKKNSLQEISVSGKTRGLSVYLDKEALRDRGEICVKDVPQTLRASFKCVDMLVCDSVFGDTDIHTRVKEKEVKSFAKTLEKLIGKDVYSAEITHIIYKAEI